ncbi:VCBS repeat-containing protein [Streptomyces poriferorum]|uniref:FG-GAP repeat domain-containing protein n=1 Tax=Streptomyces TaxID=1883 RepID=UPI00273D336F|nr:MULTISPECIES: VCBS repeat-containing protein [unclassified Streptomyces]WLQ51667.1 VCBS repeat-containing protein [Streptomyces sp. Alt1]WSI66539.1 VCBS repeat-containing protein [Streptomyces sp. NBC_01336]
MAKIFGRLPGRAATRVAAAAITAALVGTGTSAFAADTGDAPMYGITGVDSTGASYYYAPNGEGSLQARVPFDTGWKDTKFLGLVDSNADSLPDGRWQTNAAGVLNYAANDNSDLKNVGHGWGIYNKLVSAGNLGGGEAGDLLGRDSAGNLYLYLGYGDGTVTQRYKVGGGWNAYTQLAGNGDLTGDGKNDIVAADKSGVLWLYKGTGNYKAPFAARTKVGSGWNAYNTVFAPGDIDLDGTTDLVGRDAKGALYLYKGTGKAAAPYGYRTQIGTGGWNTYRLIF